VTRILIVDDHAILRRGLRDILVTQLDAVETGEAANAAAALELLIRERWDLILLDINLPGRSGLEVLEEGRRLQADTPVLVLTAYPEEQFAVQALRLGAAGYITKQEAADQLVTAVRRVLGGGRYVSNSMAERLASRLQAGDQQELHEALSPRELQILRLVALGRSLKEIAAELALSEKTVATYRSRIGEKTGLRSGIEIARYALKHHLVE
jgi:DNA-binding NarL/FixJ family response regulator